MPPIQPKMLKSVYISSSFLAKEDDDSIPAAIKTLAQMLYYTQLGHPLV